MSELDLHFTLSEHAHIRIIPTQIEADRSKDVTIEGLSLDDLIYLRDIIQDRINGYRIRITRTLL